MLNLETYEYMAGPLATAGVKVLIYNQSDTPLAALRSLALPPGYSSDIAINLQVPL